MKRLLKISEGSYLLLFLSPGFEISEYQKRQAAMTVRKVTKQKGEPPKRHQVNSALFSSLLHDLVLSYH